MMMAIVVMVAVMAMAVVAPVSIPIVNKCRSHFNRLHENGLFFHNRLHENGLFCYKVSVYCHSCY